eukprot:1065587_1
MSIQKIDNALRSYYSNNNENYLDKNEIGLFQRWCTNEGYNDSGVDEELKELECDDCGFLDFDPKHSLTNDQRKEMFTRLQSYNQHESPPKDTAQKPSVTNNLKLHADHNVSSLFDLRNGTQHQKSTKQICEKYCNELLSKTGDDKDLIAILAIGKSLKQPLFSYLIDTYERWRIDEFKSAKCNHDQKEQNAVNLSCERLWQQNAAFSKFIHNVDLLNPNKNMNYTLQTMINLSSSRIAPKLPLNRGIKIKDNLLEYIEYVIAFSKLLRAQLSDLQEIIPFQWDLWIIPNDITDESDDEYEFVQREIVKDIDGILKQNAINFNSMMSSSNDDKYRIVKQLTQTFSNAQRGTRMVFIIDRRKTPKDMLYVYQPPANINDDIATQHIDWLPEMNLCRSKKWIYPELNAFSRYEQMFVMSYHVNSVDCVRMYWCFNGWKTRFFMKDMWDIWPTSFFKQECYDMQTFERLNSLKAQLANEKDFDDKKFVQFYECVTT